MRLETTEGQAVATRVIGLDIGSSAVRAAELEFGSGGPSGGRTPTLRRVAQVGLPVGAVRDGEVTEATVVSQALHQLWAQGRFESKSVVLGVGNQRVIVRELDLPWMPPTQIKAALPFQVQDLLPVSTDDVLLDYFASGEFVGDQGRMLKGTLVAAQRETVTGNVLAAESAGLKPQMVDLNAFAAVRALARGELAQRGIAIVDIGARITTVVVAIGGVPRLVRMLPAGGQYVTDAVAAATGIPQVEAERLKREIGFGFAVPAGREAAQEAIEGIARTLGDAVRNTLSFYQGANPNEPLEQLVLTGGGIHLPGLGQYLASVTRLPAVLGDPMVGITVDKAVDRSVINGLQSSFTVAMGLAYGVAA